MVHSEFSEGKKYKPRGRPFPKGNKRGKLENGVLADSGRDSSDERGTITPNRVKFNKEPLNMNEGGYIDTPETLTEESVFSKLPSLVLDTANSIIKEAMETPAEDKEDASIYKIIETIDFKNGDNILSIRFSAVNNRRYRIQVFLNDETEVRPVTYQGSTSGNAFWKLLKGALKR